MYANTLKSIATDAVMEKINETEILMESAAKTGNLSIVVSDMTEAECQYLYDKGFTISRVMLLSGTAMKISWGLTEINDK